MGLEELGLLPWDFERLTPYEFERVLRGRRERENARREEERELLAWAVTHLMNASGWLKRPVQFEQLLKEVLGERRTEQRLRAQIDRAKQESG